MRNRLVGCGLTRVAPAVVTGEKLERRQGRKTAMAGRWKPDDQGQEPYPGPEAHAG